MLQKHFLARIDISVELFISSFSEDFAEPQCYMPLAEPISLFCSEVQGCKPAAFRGNGMGLSKGGIRPTTCTSPN